MRRNAYQISSYCVAAKILQQQMIFYKKLYPFKNKLFQFAFTFIFLFLSPISNFAQVKDTSLNSKLQIKPTYHSPKQSALMSTILPGLGQIYNKKYWKVPILYAGLAGLGYAINANQTKYIRYRTAYKYRIDGDPSTIDNYPKYSADNLNTLQQYYQRFRNLSVIGATLLYVMNIVDASVDAHMFTFDVGDDLSFHLLPTLINTTGINQYTTGLSLNIKF